MSMDEKFKYKVIELLALLTGDSNSPLPKGIEGVNFKLEAQTKVPVMLRTTGSGAIADPIFSVSFSNVGTADAILLGETLKVGETVSFSADGGINNKYAANAFTYDATGTELLIIYNS